MPNAGLSTGVGIAWHTLNSTSAAGKTPALIDPAPSGIGLAQNTAGYANSAFPNVATGTGSALPTQNYLTTNYFIGGSIIGFQEIAATTTNELQAAFGTGSAYNASLGHELTPYQIGGYAGLSVGEIAGAGGLRVANVAIEQGDLALRTLYNPTNSGAYSPFSPQYTVYNYEVVVRVAFDKWKPSLIQGIVVSDTTSGGAGGFYLELLTTGALRLQFYAEDIPGWVTSSSSVMPFVDGETYWIKVGFKNDNSLGFGVRTFSYAPDQTLEPTNWTLTNTNTGTARALGRADGNIGVAGSVTDPYGADAKFYRAILRDLDEGVNIWDVDFTIQTPSTRVFRESSGRLQAPVTLLDDTTYKSTSGTNAQSSATTNFVYGRLPTGIAWLPVVKAKVNQTVGLATGTGSAGQLIPSFAKTSTGSGSSLTPTESVQQTIQVAYGIGIAQQLTRYNAYPITATGIGSTNNIFKLTTATGTGTAFQATITINPNPGLATGTGTVNGTLGAFRLPRATGTGSAFAPSTTIPQSAGLATGTGAVSQTFGLGGKPAFIYVATGTGIANQAHFPPRFNAGEISLQTTKGLYGSGAYTLDAPQLDISSQVDILARISANEWKRLDRNNQLILAKGSPNNGWGYSFELNDEAQLQLKHGFNGVSWWDFSDTALPFKDGEVYWVRVTRTNTYNNPSPLEEIHFYWANDQVNIPTVWTEIGTRHQNTNAAGISNYDNVSFALSVGNSPDYANNLRTPNMNFYRVILRDKINGTAVWDADFTKQSIGTTSFVESSSFAATVTLTNGANTGYDASAFFNTRNLKSAVGNALMPTPSISVSVGLASGVGNAIALSGSPIAQLAAGYGAVGGSALPGLPSYVIGVDPVGILEVAGAGGAPVITVNAGLASGTGSVNTTIVNVGATCIIATGTGSPFNTSESVLQPVGLATGTGLANTLTAEAVGQSAQLASGSGSAFNASVSIGATAQLATGTGTANKPALAFTLNLATGTGSSNATNEVVGQTVGLATGTGTSFDLNTETVGQSAQLASGSGSAFNATISIGANAQIANGTGTANKPALAFTLNLATGTGASNGSNISIGQSDGLATGTGTAQTSSQSVIQPAGLASGSGTANDATGKVAKIANADRAYGVGLMATWTGTNYINMPGGSNGQNIISIPAASGSNIDNLGDLAIAIRFDRLNPTEDRGLIQRRQSGVDSALIPFGFGQNSPNGALNYIWYNAAGIQSRMFGTVVPPAGTQWVGVTHVLDDLAGHNIVKFWYSTDGTNWNLLETFTNTGATTRRTNAAQVSISASNAGIWGAVGNFYQAKIWSAASFAGSPIVDIDATINVTDPNATTFTATSGETVTISKSANGPKLAIITSTSITDGSRPRVDQSTGLASGTGSAFDLTAEAVGQSAQLANGTGSANNIPVNVGATLSLATGTGSAFAPNITFTLNAASGTGSANGTNVNDGATLSTSTGTGSATTTSQSVKTNPTLATGTGSSNTAPIKIGANVVLATGTGVAYDATASTAGLGTGNAGTATGTGLSFSISVQILQPAGLASGTGTAFDVFAKLNKSGIAQIAMGVGPMATWTGTNYIAFPGTVDSQNMIYIPAAVGSNIDLLGDLSLAIRYDRFSPVSTAARTMVQRREAGVDSQLVPFQLGINTNGTLYYQWADASGVTTQKFGSVVAPNSSGWLGVTHQLDNGAGSNVVRFYHSTDGSTWNLFETLTTAGVTTRRSNAARLNVPQANTSVYGAVGRFYELKIWDALAFTGNLIVDIDATTNVTDPNAATFTATSGQTVTVSRATGNQPKLIIVTPTTITDGSRPRVDQSTGLASGSGTAFDTGAELVGQSAQLANGNGIANDSSANVGATASTSAGTGLTFKPSIGISLTQGSGSGTANGPGTNVNQSITTIAGTGTANGSVISILVNPGLATGTGSGFTSPVKIGATTILATGTGTAFNATAQTQGIGSGNAGVATGTGNAFNASVAISQPTTIATGFGAAFSIPVSIVTNIGLSTGTGLANGSTITVGTAPVTSTGTGTAFTLTAEAVGQSAQNTNGTGNANGSNASIAATTITATGSGSANSIGIAATLTQSTGSGSANGSQVRINVSSGLGSGTGTANNSTSNIVVNPTLAIGSGTAANIPISITVNPSLATGTGIANNAVATVSVIGFAGIANGVGTGYSPSIAISVSPTQATGTGLANTFTAEAVGQSAQNINGSGSANNIASAIRVNPGLASGVGSATQAIMGVTTQAANGTGDAYKTNEAKLAAVDFASGTGTAFNASAKRNVVGAAQISLGYGQAYNAEAGDSHTKTIAAFGTAYNLSVAIGVHSNTAFGFGNIPPTHGVGVSDATHSHNPIILGTIAIDEEAFDDIAMLITAELIEQPKDIALASMKRIRRIKPQ